MSLFLHIGNALKASLVGLVCFFSLFVGSAYADNQFAINGGVIYPIKHATFVLQAGQKVIYVDPVGDLAQFKQFAAPDLILITDIHHDHLDKNLVDALKTAETKVVAPKAVIDKLGYGNLLQNEQSISIDGVQITAVAMYNLTEEKLKFHDKGRGNGYVITLNEQRIYISGDTEDVPEMRALTNIDVALICMNLPYTMTVEQAASAVLEFKPKTVLPYHYRGTEGLSDVAKFKQLVAANPDINVVQLDWYLAGK